MIRRLTCVLPGCRSAASRLSLETGAVAEKVGNGLHSRPPGCKSRPCLKKRRFVVRRARSAFRISSSSARCRSRASRLVPVARLVRHRRARPGGSACLPGRTAKRMPGLEPGLQDRKPAVCHSTSIRARTNVPKGPLRQGGVAGRCATPGPARCATPAEARRLLLPKMATVSRATPGPHGQRI